MSYNKIIMYDTLKGFYNPSKASGKVCGSCKEFKEYKEFHVNNRKKDKCQSTCIPCRKSLDTKIYKNLKKSQLKVRNKQKRDLDREARDNLEDRYIRQLICRRSNIKMEDITEQMITKRRRQVIIHREKVSKIRKCNECNISKPFSEYPKKKDCRHGITGKCKKCANKRGRDYRRNISPEQKLRNQEKHREWRKRNPISKAEKEKARQYILNQRKELSDTYIKSLLTKNTSLSFKDITQEMIDLKRLQVKLIRKSRNM